MYIYCIIIGIFFLMMIGTYIIIGTPLMILMRFIIIYYRQCDDWWNNACCVPMCLIAYSWKTPLCYSYILYIIWQQRLLLLDVYLYFALCWCVCYALCCAMLWCYAVLCYCMTVCYAVCWCCELCELCECCWCGLVLTLLYSSVLLHIGEWVYKVFFKVFEF
jgi:hypothetical protein